MGAWNDNDADMTIDKNIYWHSKLGADGIQFRYENLEQWNAKGYDVNSYIEDPLFTDPDNRIQQKTSYNPQRDYTFLKIFGIW